MSKCPKTLPSGSSSLTMPAGLLVGGLSSVPAELAPYKLGGVVKVGGIRGVVACCVLLVAEVLLTGAFRSRFSLMWLPPGTWRKCFLKFWGLA